MSLLINITITFYYKIIFKEFLDYVAVKYIKVCYEGV